MNNKGQSLVIFVLILPLILALMGICIDIGIINSEKRKIENNVKSTITYGLNNIEDKNINNKMRKLLVKYIFTQCL